MTLGRLNTHILHIYLFECAQFISCETVLCSLCDLSVTNNDFEHAHSALPHYSLLWNPLIFYSTACSRLHLMHFACANTSTHATTLIPVKKACDTSLYDTYCLAHLNKENERKNKNIKFNSWSFFFNLCYTFISLNVVLPWMTSE